MLIQIESILLEYSEIRSSTAMLIVKCMTPWRRREVVEVVAVEVKSVVVGVVVNELLMCGQ